MLKFKNHIKSSAINHRAWKSFEIVRKVHNQINLIAKKQETNLIITQADMVCTQFLYIGFQTSPYFGVMHHAKPEELESLNHLVRMIGYMLGIKDEFNICGSTFAETQGRIAAISDDFFRPNLMSPPDGYLEYAKVAADGMWHFFPTIHLDSMIFQMKRAVNVPGHCYFESEKSADDAVSSLQELRKLSYYTRIRIFIDILIFDYFTRFAFFRYLLVIFKMTFGLLEVFPVLLIMNFGWNFALAEMKRLQNIIK